MNQYPLVYLDHVTKNYGHEVALMDVSLNIQPGRIIGLLGPNGSGKTTIIKLINGLLQPSLGNIYIHGQLPSPASKKVVSYLPDTTYLNENMKIIDAIRYFQDFYADFNVQRAYQLLNDLHLQPNQKLNSLSKGNKEKVQLILVMSREADLYVLDEPIGGVDPAARDYILRTIIQNRRPNSSVLISTHLIADIEQVLDEAIFINQGRILLHENTTVMRNQYGKSIDEIFRDQFRVY
ncbi:ABC transporter ATP-binding protein [Streptococcus parasanguinis]|jgi:ABC-2 type transport system ATP-binding protein|uniref:ABC-type transporter ATP-binding protein EcsA n=3 Tax=Streptococcus parasanguinis TaxID=1318 RepID=A0A6N2ZA10_STRPA|nr:ABC transporter ATP-binding protein [Streptococcus parasanguinis]MDR3960382.1 ABC transporter ATP-binding protein [Streptococcus sp.]AFJ25782.1 ABC-type multidrug transport system, ATPase component [Streptococcus parasanguinis FW213]EIG29235.1 ABC transporter, ATP-binding protein [Streptococcus parasanguinis F0449]KJU99015.1 ABC transporter ATP-binding protein [Streptococcus parasanguinis]MBF1717115.1 ABC transporter ATP-binding protein [Streptococcus parasanguinis]